MRQLSSLIPENSSSEMRAMLMEEFEDVGVEVDKFPRAWSGTAGFGMLEVVVGDHGRISPVAQLMFGFCWTSQSRPRTTWQELSTLVTKKVHVSSDKLGIRNEVLT